MTKRTQLINRKVNTRDASLVVIATEGEKTEKEYFTLFSNPRIKVVVIPTEQGLCAPQHLLNRLDEFRERYDLSEDDELWLMADVDHRRPAELSKVCQRAIQKNIKLAISNPCFELWLHLHLDEVKEIEPKCSALEQALRRLVGEHNKAKLNLEHYKDKIQIAIERAKRLDNNPNERWPSAMGTHVYKVVERLLEFPLR